MKKVRGLDIRIARLEAKLLQWKLAAELGITATALSNIEGREELAMDEELTKGLTPAKILAAIEQLKR